MVPSRVYTSMGGGSKNARGHVLRQPGYEMRAKESKRAIPKKTVSMSVNGCIVSIGVGISLVATNRSRTRELAMTVKATAIVPTPSPTMKGARRDTKVNKIQQTAQIARGDEKSYRRLLARLMDTTDIRVAMVAHGYSIAYSMQPRRQQQLLLPLLLRLRLCLLTTTATTTTTTAATTTTTTTTASTCTSRRPTAKPSNELW